MGDTMKSAMNGKEMDREGCSSASKKLRWIARGGSHMGLVEEKKKPLLIGKVVEGVLIY